MDSPKSCCNTKPDKPAQTDHLSKTCCPSQKEDVPTAAQEKPAFTPSFFKAASETIKKYAPVIGVFGLAAVGSIALDYGAHSSLMGLMHYFMGLTLLNFALLKIGNVTAFADTFEKYDILAKKSRSYAVSYPFIEAALGIGYLAHHTLPVEAQAVLYGATFVITAIGTIGVAKALLEGKNDLKCACVGGDKNLPLSKVALAENISMGAMSAAMFASLMI
ncbi:MAG: MauE/DoxX family redox-associated membrane protein [Alphaproteobacteria bacterium]